MADNYHRVMQEQQQREADELKEAFEFEASQRKQMHESQRDYDRRICKVYNPNPQPSVLLQSISSDRPQTGPEGDGVQYKSPTSYWWFWPLVVVVFLGFCWLLL